MWSYIIYRCLILLPFFSLKFQFKPLWVCFGIKRALHWCWTWIHYHTVTSHQMATPWEAGCIRCSAPTPVKLITRAKLYLGLRRWVPPTIVDRRGCKYGLGTFTHVCWSVLTGLWSIICTRSAFNCWRRRPVREGEKRSGNTWQPSKDLESCKFLISWQGVTCPVSYVSQRANKMHQILMAFFFNEKWLSCDSTSKWTLTSSLLSTSGESLNRAHTHTHTGMSRTSAGGSRQDNTTAKTFLQFNTCLEFPRSVFWTPPVSMCNIHNLDTC